MPSTTCFPRHFLLTPPSTTTNRTTSQHPLPKKPKATTPPQDQRQQTHISSQRPSTITMDKPSANTTRAAKTGTCIGCTKMGTAMSLGVFCKAHEYKCNSHGKEYWYQKRNGCYQCAR